MVVRGGDWAIVQPASECLDTSVRQGTSFPHIEAFRRWANEDHQAHGISVTCCNSNGRAQLPRTCSSLSPPGHAVTYQEALQHCEDMGFRLCRADEMAFSSMEGLDSWLRNSHCRFEYLLGWSSDDCSPGDWGHMARGGGGDLRNQAQCLPDSYTESSLTPHSQASHFDNPNGVGVSCCKERDQNGRPVDRDMAGSEVGVYRNDCLQAKTFAEAKHECERRGYRLCESIELQNNVVENGHRNGCMELDNVLNWVSDTCNPTVTTPAPR